jgi:hypothetical protein
MLLSLGLGFIYPKFGFFGSSPVARKSNHLSMDPAFIRLFAEIFLMVKLPGLRNSLIPDV